MNIFTIVMPICLILGAAACLIYDQRVAHSYRYTNELIGMGIAGVFFLLMAIGALSSMPNSSQRAHDKFAKKSVKKDQA